MAQIFPGQDDDTNSSMGVFRITVDPAFRPLSNRNISNRRANEKAAVGGAR